MGNVYYLLGGENKQSETMVGINSHFSLVMAENLANAYFSLMCNQIILLNLGEYSSGF